MHDDADEWSPDEQRLIEAARLALAGGALDVPDLVGRLVAAGVVDPIGPVDPPEAAESTVMGVLLELGEFWVTDGATAAIHLPRRLASAWFTHRLTAADLDAGRIPIGPDLAGALAPVLAADGLRLVRGGVDLGAVQVDDVLAVLDGDRSDDHDDDAPNAALWGPDGWLDGFAVGDVVAIRRADEIVELAPATVRDGAGGREAELVRAAYDALVDGRSLAVWLYAVVADALAGNDHLFRRPVRPLGELLAETALAFASGRIGPAGSDFLDDAAREDAASMVAGTYALRDCCLEAFHLAADALVAHAHGAQVTADRALASALAHGDVAAAVLDFADAWRPDDGAVLAAALAGAFREQQGRDRAGGASLLGGAAERIGEIPTAQALYEEAVLADPSLDVAIDNLARLVAIRGDLDTAIRLRTRIADVDPDDEDDFDPDLAFLLALRPPRVTGVGRNDPCPCGSGRKYKTCCLNKPPALGPDAHELWLDQKLASYAARPGHFVRIWALALAARGDDPRIDEFIDSGVPTMWLLYDDGIVHEFAARYRDALPEIEQPMLDARCAAVRVVVRVVAIAGDTITVRDVATGAVHHVVDDHVVTMVAVGDLVTTRLAHSTTGSIFAGVPTPVPAALEAELLELLTTAPDARTIAQWYRRAAGAVSS